ncbi:hypothetical protein J1605_001764 [Eschrichtius robustus]|uniref:Uncharacterized protein n=1 Tax=Eschrichtius robustus TaxID=9764 RepID=A0AB34HZ75_ESCRO|nr:hypothetical protein J1605_001764 [Eschrichtius robustus]
MEEQQQSSPVASTYLLSDPEASGSQTTPEAMWRSGKIKAGGTDCESHKAGGKSASLVRTRRHLLDAGRTPGVPRRRLSQAATALASQAWERPEGNELTSDPAALEPEATASLKIHDGVRKTATVRITSCSAPPTQGLTLLPLSPTQG